MFFGHLAARQAGVVAEQDLTPPRAEVSDIWALPARLQTDGRVRELALVRWESITSCAVAAL